MWAWQAWRCYAWQPGYCLTLTTAEHTAYVDMIKKVVVCNLEYPSSPLKTVQQVRHPSRDVREFQMHYLESLIARRRCDLPMVALAFDDAVHPLFGP